MAELQVDIISPEKPVYSGKALSVVAKAWDGEVGILPGHAPMITRLGAGEVRITRGTLANAVTDRFAIAHGFLEVANDTVVLLTEKAAAVKDLAGVKQEDIDALVKQISEERDAGKRSELEQRLEWLRSSEKLSVSAK